MEEEAESERKSNGKEKTRGGRRFTLDAGTPSACEDRR